MQLCRDAGCGPTVSPRPEEATDDLIADVALARDNSFSAIEAERGCALDGLAR